MGLVKGDTLFRCHGRWRELGNSDQELRHSWSAAQWNRSEYQLYQYPWNSGQNDPWWVRIWYQLRSNAYGFCRAWILPYSVTNCEPECWRSLWTCWIPHGWLLIQCLWTLSQIHYHRFLWKLVVLCFRMLLNDVELGFRLVKQSWNGHDLVLLCLQSFGMWHRYYFLSH